MMLVELPAMDAVVSVHVHVSWPALPASFAAVARLAARPTLWLVLLATLVILSSIRAALLFLRSPTLHQACVSAGEKPAPSIPCPAPTVAATPPAQQRPTTSWLWGLVKWDALPALPIAAARGWVQHQGLGVARQQQMQQVQQPRGRRGPAFDHPSTSFFLLGVFSSVSPSLPLPLTSFLPPLFRPIPHPYLCPR